MKATIEMEKIENYQLVDLERQLTLMRDVFRLHQNEIRKKYKISSTEMEIILYVHDFGPHRMKNVGEKFRIKFSTLTSLVDKIERFNLVRRVSSKEDRRAILITITRKGQRMLEEYNGQVKSLAEEMNQAVKEGSLIQFLENLEKTTQLQAAEIESFEE